MPVESIHQPHDKLFKAGFSDPVEAAAFLRYEFSPSLSAKIDWGQLRLEPGSFVDSHFRHSESDLLFSAPLLGSPCLVYLLFEHQSSPEPGLALRLLRYMVRIWESRIRSHPLPSPLPVILPVVLAQNADIWDVQTRFSTLLGSTGGIDDDLRPWIPDFAFRLIQLAAIPYDAFQGSASGIMTLRLMKAERVAQLLCDSVWDEKLLMQLPVDAFARLVRYILGADIDIEAFDRKIQTITQAELRSTTMTLADQILERGRSQGIERGLREALIEALLIRFDSIPEGLRQVIGSICDPARLRALHKTAIQAATVEEFARDL